MAEMLEHMSEYLYDFMNFIFASIRCTIPNFQTCEQFCCLLYIHPPSQWVSQDISHAFRMGQLGYIHPPSQWVGPDISYAFRTGQLRYITCLQNGSAEIYPPPFTVGWPRYNMPSEWVGRAISHAFRMGWPR